MASVTTTTFDPALKQLYRDSNIENATYRRRPALGSFPKFEDFGGRNMPIVLLHGNPQGRSAVFATAQNNASSVLLDDFLLTRVSDFSVATIDGEVAEASQGDSVAFLSALKTQIDGAMDALADAIESFIFRSGTGSMGTVGSFSTTLLTLADINDVTNFEVNMQVVLSAADGGALRDSGDDNTITGVNRVTGVLTGAIAWTTEITGATAADFIYAEGDAANAGANVKISGLAAWLPSADPSGGESFFGVDRSTDSRKFGQRHDGSTQLVEEALIDAQSKASREGGAPDTVLLNHVQQRRLIKELGSKKEYTEVNATGEKGMVASVGYRGVVIQGDSTVIKVIAANKCQSNVAWVLEMKTWQLATLGKATKFLMLDGQRILRQSSSDGYEVRLGFRGNLGCKAPNWNVRCTLPTAT